MVFNVSKDSTFELLRIFSRMAVLMKQVLLHPNVSPCPPSHERCKMQYLVFSMLIIMKTLVWEDKNVP